MSLLAYGWRVLRRYKAYMLWLFVCFFLLMILFNKADDPRAHHQRARGKPHHHRSHNASHTEHPRQGPLKPPPMLHHTPVDDSQSARKKNVIQACKMYGDDSKLQPSRLYVIEKYKTVVCTLANAGKTEWKSYFSDLCLQKPNFCGKFKSLDTFGKEEQNKIMKSYYKVMYVRDPLDRLWSTHTKNFMNINPQYFFKHGAKIAKLLRPESDEKTRICGDNITFPELLKYVSHQHQEKQQFDERWETFHQSCDPCNIHYDYIGKMESFQQDFETIRSAAKIPALREEKGKWEELKNKFKLTQFHDFYVRDRIEKFGLSKKFLDTCHPKSSRFQSRMWKKWITQGMIDPRIVTIKQMLTLFKFLETNHKNWEKWSDQVVDYIMDKVLPKRHKERDAIKLIAKRKDKVQAERFQSMDSAILTDIKNIYKADLEMFGYAPPEIKD